MPEVLGHRSRFGSRSTATGIVSPKSINNKSPRESPLEGSACGACELRSNSSECQRASNPQARHAFCTTSTRAHRREHAEESPPRRARRCSPPGTTERLADEPRHMERPILPILDHSRRGSGRGGRGGRGGPGGRGGRGRPGGRGGPANRRISPSVRQPSPAPHRVVPPLPSRRADRSGVQLVERLLHPARSETRRSSRRTTPPSYPPTSAT